MKLTVIWGHDSTRVWFCTRILDEVGGKLASKLRRHDEGGTVSQGWMAEKEAKEIAERLTKKGHEVTVKEVENVDSVHATR